MFVTSTVRSSVVFALPREGEEGGGGEGCRRDSLLTHGVTHLKSALDAFSFSNRLS